MTFRRGNESGQTWTDHHADRL